MRPTQLFATLKNILPIRRPVFIWGPPGIGKSQITAQVVKSLDLDFIDVRAVLLDPVDLRGVPTVERNGDGVSRTKWAVPNFLPHGRDSKGVLFLDETPQAPPMVQAALLQLTLDRRIGEYVLPDGWIVVAAGNRSEDRAGAHRLITPLLNRFIHLDLDVSNDDWRTWALEAGVVGEVVSFLAWRPSLLHQFDPSQNARAFATPRSWQFVSDILPHATGADLFDLVNGCVGEGPAAEFVAFTRIYRGLPDIDACIRSPKSFVMPNDPSILYATCGAVVERVRHITDKQLLGNVASIAERMSADFGVLLMRDCYQISKAIRETPEAKAWLKKNTSFFFGDK